jgi:hypothetical protein
MHNCPYNKIREALEELEAVSHHNKEQEQLWEVLRSTAFRAHNGGTAQDYPPDQHPIDKRIKVKGRLPIS